MLKHDLTKNLLRGRFRSHPKSIVDNRLAGFILQYGFGHVLPLDLASHCVNLENYEGIK
jgi:hypothetical protein